MITTALAASLHFGSNHSDAIGFVQETGLMPRMVETSRFSRRIHRVGELVADLLLQLGHVFKTLSASMVYRIDSFPINCCHNIRIPRSRLFKEEQYRGRNASKRRYRRATPFYGIKVFVMTDEANRPVEYCRSAFRFVRCKNSKKVITWNALKMRVSQHQRGCLSAFG